MSVALFLGVVGRRSLARRGLGGGGRLLLLSIRAKSRNLLLFPEIFRDVSTSVDMTKIRIRPATDSDRDAIWKIFHEVVASGDTYPLDPNISRKDALAYWFQPGGHAYVAELDCLKQSSLQEDHCLVGTYILRSNQSGGGAHVAKAAFIVPKAARGQGIGRAMGEHCLNEARRLGFRAMQFNFVVSTNESAVKLWQSLGMKIIGTLPGAFRHPEKGYVDVYVMFQSFENA